MSITETAAGHLTEAQQEQLRELLRFPRGSYRLVPSGPAGGWTNVNERPSIRKIRDGIGGGNLDTVNLLDPWTHGHLGLVMLVDDIGSPQLADGSDGKGLPVNELATWLYWARCRPGTTHQIRGPVALCHDIDFA